MTSRAVRSLLLILGAAGLAAAAGRAADSPGRERVSFNADWRFTRGDAAGVGESLTYERIKDWILPTGDDLLHYLAVRRTRPEGSPGGLPAYARADFNDSTWRLLNLPHDWGIEGPFQQELSGDTGKLPWFGVGWYRKKFNLPATAAGRQTYLELDGAMAYALVWCNGQFVGGWPYGYASWRVDLTAALKPGADNVIAIRLDNPRESSRWYPGGGIYRNVWLLQTAPIAVAQWGVTVTTPIVSRDSATVSVAIELDSKSAAAADVTVGVRLFAADAGGRATGEPLVSSQPGPVKLPPGRTACTAHTLILPSPRLWSLKERNRYVAETTVTQGDTVLDRVSTPFGVRTLAFTRDDGFLLNGERVMLNGVCDHHDLGALGAALNVRALERQLEILQAMGCNAIRTSHNPPAPELLELCDRMGFVVMVEAFDCWRIGKRRDDYSRLFDDWHEKDLTAMVRRDRNHPSVIQWSIGNEIREQYETDGWKLAAHLAGIVRGEDRTRPVVAGLNNLQSGYNGFQTVVDIVGYNYKPTEYAKLKATHPELVIMGSETASCISSRGEYFFPVDANKDSGRADFQVSSYDLYAPRWATPPENEWRGLDGSPGVLGEFVWTGFDYLGEPTPYNADQTNLLNFSDPADQARMAQELKELGRITVPSRSSYFGIIDLAGFPKDRYYLYQSRWRADLPMVHLLPHWTWPERVGLVTPVMAYTAGDEAELFLNGRSLGRKARGPGEYRFRWDDVKYAPGELMVVAYRHGVKWAEDVRRTAGAAAQLQLAADRTTVHADGQDLSFVTLTVADAAGIMVPRAKNKLTFEVSGPGEVIATDNGDATSFESFQSPVRKAYNGLALAIIRTKPGQTGPITVRAKADGLTPAEITLTAVP